MYDKNRKSVYKDRYGVRQEGRNNIFICKGRGKVYEEIGRRERVKGKEVNVFLYTICRNYICALRGGRSDLLFFIFSSALTWYQLHYSRVDLKIYSHFVILVNLHQTNLIGFQFI